MNEAEARLGSFADFERKGLLSGKVEPNFFAIAQDLRAVLDELARVREERDAAQIVAIDAGQKIIDMRADLEAARRVMEHAAYAYTYAASMAEFSTAFNLYWERFGGRDSVPDRE